MCKSQYSYNKPVILLVKIPINKQNTLRNVKRDNRRRENTATVDPKK